MKSITLLKARIQAYPLISYVLLTYLISWSFLYPCYQMLLNAEEGTFPPLALIGLIGAFGPTIVAIWFTRILKSKAAVSDLLKKYLVFRVPVIYYLLILLGPIIIQLIGLFISSIAGYEIGALNLGQGFKNYLPYLLITLPFGPLAEELGWRGYLLPELLKKYTAIQASVILGLVWTFWHLASFSFPGAAIPSAFEVNIWSVGFYTLQLVFLSIIFTFIFLRTRASVFIAILLHAAFNANENIAFSFFSKTFESIPHLQFLYITFIGLLGLLAIIVCFIKLQPNQKEPS